MAEAKRKQVTTGTEKAAKLLMVLGEERAAGVLNSPAKPGSILTLLFNWYKSSRIFINWKVQIS